MSLMSLAGFRAAFPEFKTASDELVNSRLGQASLRLDVDVWGTRLPEGHGLLTAHLLATSPYGMMARLSSKEGESTYGRQFKELTSIVAGLSLRVI